MDALISKGKTKVLAAPGRVGDGPWRSFPVVARAPEPPAVVWGRGGL